MEIFFAVLSGVLVFVFSQFAYEYLIKSLQDYKQIKRDIAYMLIKYMLYYVNPLKVPNNALGTIEKYSSISSKTRKMAAELSSFADIMPKKHICIPEKKILKEVSSDLIGLSNSMFLPYGISEGDDTAKNNRILIKRIRNGLKIDVDEK